MREVTAASTIPSGTSCASIRTASVYGNPGGIVAGDRARAIDPDLQVQAVVAQKNRGRRAWLTQKTDELLRARQGGTRAVKLDDKLPVFDRVSGRMLVAALQQRAWCLPGFA